MIRIMYFRHPKNPLNFYIEDKIEKANFQDTEVEVCQVDEETIEKYDLTTFQTVIFFDKKERELTRLINPVCSVALEEAYLFAQGKLSNMMLQGATQ